MANFPPALDLAVNSKSERDRSDLRDNHAKHGLDLVLGHLAVRAVRHKALK